MGVEVAAPKQTARDTHAKSSLDEYSSLAISESSTEQHRIFPQTSFSATITIQAPKSPISPYSLPLKTFHKPSKDLSPASLPSLRSIM